MRRLIALLTAVASLALPASAGAQLASTSWPQVGHDPQMTNRTSVVGTQTGTLAAGFPVNLVGHGMGYTTSGRQLWVDPAIDRLGGLTAISGTALGARGTVIAPISNGVAAFSATTGKQVWSYNATAPISGPPIVDAIGDVYIATQAGDTNITGFAALDAQGQKLWTGFAPTYTQSSGPSLGNDGTLYFAEYGGALYAYTDPS